MELVLFFASWVGHQVPLLGHDEYAVREAAHRRLDNPLAALFLPATSDDAEIDYRLRRLRAQNLKWFDPRRPERILHATDYRAWMQRYVIDGDPRAYTLAEVFGEMRADRNKVAVYMELTGCGTQPWLTGPIFPHEFDQFLAHRAGLRAAPMPRAK